MSTDSGCFGTSTVNVTVVPKYDVFIPNVFTPNGDGVNDDWQIFGNMKSVKQLNVAVFNRWGEKVFESNDINFGWNGKYQAEFAPPGVYTYTAKFVWLNNHSDNNYKGTITLIR
jgi:gliding motility-associated-like protein